MESTGCGLLKTPQACCHPWTNWMSVHQHQFRHMTFPPCTHQSEFLDNMIRGGHRKLARSFNLCY